MDREEKKEIEFDPSESEDFYKQLEKVLSMDEKNTLAERIIDEEPSDLDMKFHVEPPNTVVSVLDEEEDDLSEDLFVGVSAALAQQIEQEFGHDVEMSASIEPKKQQNKWLEIWSSIPNWGKIIGSVILGILLLVGFLFGTEPGQRLMYNVAVNFVFGKINVDPEEPTPTIVPDNNEVTVTIIPDITITQTPEPTIDPNATPVPTIAQSTNSIMQDENVVNVLLLGEENIYGASRGRTDAILVASLDKRTGQISLVSFLRDIYVRIPGRSDDRLNASYSYGGPRLIMETIETNFKIKLDGYVLINFSGFEDIIDQLGGLRISLTAQESNYLNTTEYISKKSERNTVAGYQNMTGSQVLGYCRVRYVPTSNGLKDDFGRNYRHRVVLGALFEKYKEKNIAELLSVMNNCFGYVTASESLKEVAADCLEAVVEQRNFDVQTLQIPKNGHYSNAIIQGKDVITFYPDNVDIIQEFLYGTEE